MLFKPRARKSKVDRIIMSVLMVLLVLTMLLLRNFPGKLLYYVTLACMAAIYLYHYYLVRSIDRLYYQLKAKGVFIHYGFKKLLIPYKEIMKVERVARPNWKKLLGTEWNEYHVGYFNEYKHGIINLFATNRENLILITTTKGKYGISPENNNAFMEEINKRWVKKPSLPVEEPAVTKAQEMHIWQSTPGKILIFLNVIMLGVLIFLTIIVSSNQMGNIALNMNPQGEVIRNKKPYELYLLLVGAVIWSTHRFKVTDILSRENIEKAYRFLWIPFGFSVIVAIILLAMLV